MSDDHTTRSSHWKPGQSGNPAGKPPGTRNRASPVAATPHWSAATGLRQEFITPHTPEQNGMLERVIRTLKGQCAHRHRFETLQHASRVIGDWISFYYHRRPHQALGMQTPAATFALAA